MFDTINKFMGSRTRTATGWPEARVAPKVAPQREAGPHDRQVGFSKVFRWPVPAAQVPQPTKVEVVGSFSDWQKVPLVYDKPTRTWTTTLTNIRSNHTHQYVILVDGKPSYDKACDGLAAPQGPKEAQWQIETARGPRVMLLFSQTK